MAYKIGEISIKLKLNPGITFWQAIKLRIAGKAYRPIAEKIGDAIAAKITEQV